MANRFYIPFELHKEIYTPNEVIDVLKLAINEHMTYGNNKGIYCYNVPCAFDIETSSFYVDEETNSVVNYETLIAQRTIDPKYKPKKVAIMYVWQFGINGRVIVGRTWLEFVNMIQSIHDYLSLGKKKRLIVYVHNLAYEFQFIRKWFEWDKVFAIEERKPLYAITKSGIEFRCSLLLSGYSLANLSKQLRYFPVSKMVGDLDYQLIRHSGTPLSDKELGYCINDVLVVMSYIYDCIQDENDLWQIPMTKTGYVRRYCKENCLYVPNTRKRDLKYKEWIESLTIDTVEEFDLIQSAFMGGFTHANARYSGKVMYDVASYDFTSSYPYVLLAEKFPMSKGIRVEVKTLDELEEYITNYCCVFEVAFTNIMGTKIQENYLSVSKCGIRKNVTVDNGRVVCADLISTVITNVDYEIISKFYKWDSISIGKFYIYKRFYLPTQLVKCILKLYGDKTTLKGVEGREVDYMLGKGMLNSVYGMCVTNPLRDEFVIDEMGEQWDTVEALGDKRQELLDRYNTNSNRFLYYLWGVFCTAYARYNLFTGIEAMGDDYLYADTDSIKVVNYTNHRSYFEAYNALVRQKLIRAAKHHNIPFSHFAPKTVKGDEKLIGVWDFEGVYTSFKTLGAKRYAVEVYTKDGKPNGIRANGITYPVSITVSGVNKFTAIDYLFNDLAKGDVKQFMANFEDGLHVSAKHSGKLLHTYIDEVREGIVIDYLGNEATYLELSSVHLEPTSYDLSIASDYANFILGLQDKEY